MREVRSVWPTACTTNWGIPKWIEIGALSATDGAGPYSWNTRGLAAGTYYLAGYLYDDGLGYLSHLTAAITSVSSRPIHFCQFPCAQPPRQVVVPATGPVEVGVPPSNRRQFR